MRDKKEILFFLFQDLENLSHLFLAHFCIAELYILLHIGEQFIQLITEAYSNEIFHTKSTIHKQISY